MMWTLNVRARESRCFPFARASVLEYHLLVQYSWVRSIFSNLPPPNVNRSMRSGWGKGKKVFSFCFCSKKVGWCPDVIRRVETLLQLPLLLFAMFESASMVSKLYFWLWVCSLSLQGSDFIAQYIAERDAMLAKSLDHKRNVQAGTTLWCRSK